MKKNGYTLLLIVLIVTSVALSVGIFLKLQKITETKTIGLMNNASATYFEAQSCLEEGVRRLKYDPLNYRSDTLAILGSTCTITIIDQGSDYIIDIHSVHDSLVKKLRASVIIGENSIALNFWEEIP